MTIQVIDTGYFYADGGAMFGAIPKTAWQRRYLSDPDNRCILAMRSLLIKTDDHRVILVDNGAGNKHLNQLSFYRFFGLKDLATELKHYQISPGEITDVILTHLHFDHCGYTTLQNPRTGKLTLAFPRANHWVSQSQWENAINPNPLEKDSYFRENTATLQESGLLKLIHQDTELGTNITLRLYNGHTPGQIVPYIQTKETTFVFAGDVIPLVASVSPEWISAYDTHPVVSYQEKIRMLEEASVCQQTLIYCHDAYTLSSQIKRKGVIYTAENKTKLNPPVLQIQTGRGIKK